MASSRMDSGSASANFESKRGYQMRKRLLFGFALMLATAELWAAAVPIPRAVVTDPAPDTKHPPFNVPLLIPSEGSQMLGLLFAASGPGPKPLVILTHGLPGNERNLDLAQAIRRAGWDVLTFTYRGAWGSEGNFSIANSMADTGAALDWARSAEAKELGIDKRRIVIAGHSLGGATALITAAHSSGLSGLILIDAWNPALTVRRTAKASAEDQARFRESFSSYGPSLRLIKKDNVADELLANADQWDLSRFAPTLKALPVLSVSAERANAEPNLELAKTLRAAGNKRVTAMAMPTNHSFDDHRIALAGAIVAWLQKLKPPTR